MKPRQAAIDARAMRWVWGLGLAGLIPFLAHTLAAAWFARPSEALVVASQIQYAAIILSFVGAIHWGVVLAGGHEQSGPQIAGRLLWGVTPSLYAFWAVQFTHPRPLLWLAGGLLVALAVDWRWYAAASPMSDLSRFRTVRAVLTVVAVISLVITWLAVQR